MLVRSEAMSAITQCPECDTYFKVSQDQLDACQGLVRCGRCQVIFNATQHLCGEQPSPQLELPIMPEEDQARSVAGTNESAPEKQEDDDKHDDDSSSQRAPTEAEIPVEPQLIDETGAIKEEIASSPLTLAQQITIAEGALEYSLAAPKKKKKYRRWPWVIACLLLLALMLAQAAYFFRIELAARLPGLKPALISYCMLLKCSVPLPRKIDLMSIESSDLAADPVKANLITLSAILRNHAPYAQAYPDLELTFTDTQDKVVARRTFKPGEYLKHDDNEQRGLASNRESSVTLHLDTSDLKPAGYRLFLYYP